MNNQIKDFIEANINLIENNSWEEIYNRASDTLTWKPYIKDFTEVMLNAGIHPELYLKELPEYFLSGSRCQEFIIPNHITNIRKFAFFHCTSLTNVIIGDNVTSIDENAFYYCSSLTHVTIPNNVIRIGDDAFADCGDNLTINYSGTKAEWKKIYNAKNFQNTYFTVNCTDGKIVKKKR